MPRPFGEAFSPVWCQNLNKKSRYEKMQHSKILHTARLPKIDMQYQSKKFEHELEF